MDIDVQIAESLIEAFNHEETGILLWDKNDKLLYRNIDMEKRFIRLNIPVSYTHLTLPTRYRV